MPQTRGRSRSRTLESVLSQAEQLVDGGYAEIVLTGVHAGEYGLDLGAGEHLLAELMRRLLDIPGLARLRLSSIEPSTVTDEILELVAGEERIARHFHMPFQSGSNDVLRAMRRRYSREDFIALVEKVSNLMPDCGIGTDMICGFPGESDDDFQQSFDCLAALPITYLHAFTYSVRPGSDAQTMGDPVPSEAKKRRVRALKKLSQDKNLRFRERQLGREVDVLPESSQRRGSSHLSGWTDNYLRVDLGRRNFVPPGLYRVRITGVSEDGLIGEPVG